MAYLCEVFFMEVEMWKSRIRGLDLWLFSADGLFMENSFFFFFFCMREEADPLPWDFHFHEEEKKH